MRRGGTPRECKRSGVLRLTVVCLSCLLILDAGAESRKVRVGDSQTAQALIAGGGKLVEDYGGFQVIETTASPGGSPLIPNADERDVIELNSARIVTRSASGSLAAKAPAAFNGRKLHLVQFVGPIKPEWRAELEATGAQILSYVPNNAYLVYLTATTLVQIQSGNGVTRVIQWEGDFADEYKLQPGARLSDANGFPTTPDSDTFVIQLVDDPAINATTLALIDQWKIEPRRRDFRVLQYRNLVVRLPAERLPEIAAQPDVISIQPYVDPEKRDERQAQIIAGNLAGALPSGPGYLAWLAGKGFTQEQFNESGFVVDVTDSGIDNGSTQPGHFGLYRGGDPAQASRVAYNRVVGTPHAGSTTEGNDGHGNLNAHILAGYNDFAAGFPHADAQGFRYGLGVCPFVRVGASVVFDPDLFTSPVFSDLQSRAYQDGARISANSWGMTYNTYTVDSQAFDALVRDAQPDGSAFPATGNQEMVIIFAAGNRGAGFNTVGAPGTAKNVITVGASEGVRSLNTANGGNSVMGSDGCGYTDASADGAFDVASFSSRGPCSDGRQKPDLIAPGTHIVGGVGQHYTTTGGNGLAITGFKASSICALNGGGVLGSAFNFFPLGQQFYTVASGTSHATPAVAGAAALLRQYFLNHELPPPSPAMTKAFLMNSARYLVGAGAGDNLWSPAQGMGEVNLGRALDGVSRVSRDQLPEDMFTASGQARVFTGRIADTNQPFRVTLAWTDAPGSTVGNAFNNNLDLLVKIGTNTYAGNQFNGSTSVPGGSADARNNVESVLLPAGGSGDFTITVLAANINSDGVPNVGSNLDQDFALVIYNAESTQVPVLSVADSSVVAESCFPANGAVDDGETVSVSIALRNTGTAPTTNLTVSLLATNGVMSPGGDQDYGSLATNGTPVSRVFQFTASGACGGSIRPVLVLKDGGSPLTTLELNLSVGLARTQTESFTNPATISIPDTGKAGLYPSTIVVTGLTGTVTKVTATLEGYTHSWPDDVDVLLVGPEGQRVLLLADCGGGQALSELTLTFDDNAVASLPDATAISSGGYKPTNFDTTSDNLLPPAPASPFGSTLSVLNGTNPNGNWSLYVQDDGALDAGSISRGWMLSVTTSNHTCCSSAGLLADLGISNTLSTGDHVPGSNVTIAVTITNRGPDPVGFVTVSNQLPAGLGFNSASVSQGVCSHQSGLVVASLGALDVGAVATLEMRTVALTAGSFTNATSVHGLAPDPQPMDNTASLTVLVTNAFVLVDPGGGGNTTNYLTRLGDIADRIVHAGSLVIVTNSIEGSNSAASYSLDSGAPAGAFIHPVSGLFTWQTADDDANTTNAITVRASDPGPPAWSDAKSFQVAVVTRPLIAGLVVNSGTVTVAWNSLIGQMYRLERSSQLPAAVWLPASPDILATGTVTTHTNAFDPSTSQFYRVRVLP